MGLPFLDSFSAAAGRGVWHADELGLADAQVVATGHAALDAELPGGGWPVGAMTELLLAAPEAHVWRLLLPALAQAVATRGGPVVLIGAPYEPCGASLAAQGLPVEALMWVRSEAPAARLWACEQALRCAEVAAVVAWLPQARVGELRRLQLAAAQHEVLLFVCRPESVALSSSPPHAPATSAITNTMAITLSRRRTACLPRAGSNELGFVDGPGSVAGRECLRQTVVGGLRVSVQRSARLVDAAHDGVHVLLGRVAA